MMSLVKFLAPYFISFLFSRLSSGIGFVEEANALEDENARRQLVMNAMSDKLGIPGVLCGFMTELCVYLNKLGFTPQAVSDLESISKMSGSSAVAVSVFISKYSLPENAVRLVYSLLGRK